MGIYYDQNTGMLIDSRSQQPASGQLIQSLQSATVMGTIQPDVELQVDQATR